MKELLRRFAAWCGFFRCPVCNERGGNGRNDICPECLKQFEFLPVQNRCKGCGGKNESIMAVCSGCMEFPRRPYEDAVAVMEYSGAGRTLIRQMKFRNRPELARPLARLAVEKLLESGMAFDVIVPIPLHWSRLLYRSYNQTELIASLISSATGKPLIHGLKKIKATPHQSRLKKSKRQKFLKNTFAVRDGSFAGKKVLLLDDVLTTGATLSTAAKVLLKNGAASVKVLCCARTPLKVKSRS
jgi:ComF family protein